jgi:hypothetical protein
MGQLQVVARFLLHQVTVSVPVRVQPDGRLGGELKASE